MNANDLEERLISFSVNIISLSKILERTYAGRQLSNQLIRASISSTLNYGEARPAESSRDFIHKIKLVVKELKEINIGLKICSRATLLDGKKDKKIFQESHELVAIFVKISHTASKNLKINPKS